MEIKLSKEIEFEGKKYAELAIDLDELTGRDLVDAGVEASAITGDMNCYGEFCTFAVRP